MTLERVCELLDTCTADAPFFPPTLLYNEGWLLRLMLDWFSKHKVPDFLLTFSENARWFSEARLPSAFLPRRRGDPLAESHTHVDGVIGHFVIGSRGKADLSLLPDATQFVVLEAKMFSDLSPSVRNVSYFDQAARNVACIAEVLKRAKRSASDLSCLGFYVLAPQSQIARGIFDKALKHEMLQQKVERRVQEYAGTQDEWFINWFQPALQKIELQAISWEAAIAMVREYDLPSANSLEQFYRRCSDFNS